MKHHCSKLLLALGIACIAPSTANAAILVTVAQSGTNVVATLSGSLNLTGLTALPSPFGLSTAVQPSRGYIGLGASTLTTGYTGLSGPGVFGPGTVFTNATSNSGDGFGLDAFFLAQTLFLPTTYVSGALLNGSSTFNNTTIAGLGLTVGQYVFRSSADTVTINIAGAATAVPEPATWSILLVGFGLVGARVRSRRRGAVATHTSRGFESGRGVSSFPRAPNVS